MAAEMSVERRFFLAGASASVATALAATAWAKTDDAMNGDAEPQPTPASVLDSPLLAHHDFAPAVGQIFQASVASGASFPLRLERVEVQRLSPRDVRRVSPRKAGSQAAGSQAGALIGSTAFPIRTTPFTLIFTAPLGVSPWDSLVRLSHDRLGELDMFLQPLPSFSASSGITVVAVFG